MADASMSDERPKRILLTGCCGYIGSWATVELLRAGYCVRGTSIDVAYARALFTAALTGTEAPLVGRLEIVHAELLDPGSWQGLADDCDVVVHTACPVITDVGVPEAAMLRPATEGTENVLREVARAGSAVRVIHLSSIVTLLDHHRPVRRGASTEVVGPGDWNETASPATDPYAHAKVIGERRARALVAELLPAADFVSLLPGPVIGPPVGGERVPASLEKSLGPLLSGQLKTGSVDLALGLVDVRDVARAIVALVALERDAVTQLGERSRFVCASRPSPRLQDLADVLRDEFPELSRRLPRRALPIPNVILLAAMRLTVSREAASYARAMMGRKVDYDNTLCRELLGLTFTDLRASLRASVGWLRARGHYA